jgi:hypothetical protein
VRSIAIACALLALGALAGDAAAARAGKRQLWGAIAYDSKSGAVGYAVDRKTRREAESEAFRQCGDCDVIRTFRDNCGAVAERTGRFAWETGALREIAEKKALQKCGGDCKIAVWACTTEK